MFLFHRTQIRNVKGILKEDSYGHGVYMANDCSVASNISYFNYTNEEGLVKAAIAERSNAFRS